MLKIDASVPVNSRDFTQKRALQKHISDSGLTNVVNVGGRQYTLRHGKVLVEAISAGIAPGKFRRKVEKDLGFSIIVHDPDALFNVIDQQRRDRAVIVANSAARRQTALRGDVRSVAAAGSKLRGNVADKHDESRSAKTVVAKAERKRRYENNESFFCLANKAISHATAPIACRERRENVFMARATARPPSSSSGGDNPQAVLLCIPGAEPPGQPLRLPPLGLKLVDSRPPQKRGIREPNLLRLRRLRKKMTTTCTFVYRGRTWHQ